MSNTNLKCYNWLKTCDKEKRITRRKWQIKIMREDGFVRAQGLSVGSLSLQWKEDEHPRGTLSPVCPISTKLAPFSRFYKWLVWHLAGTHLSTHAFAGNPCTNPSHSQFWGELRCHHRIPRVLQDGAWYLSIHSPKGLWAHKDLLKAIYKPLFPMCR